MLLIQSSDSDVEDVVRIANTDPGEIGKRLRQILKRIASEGFIALSDYRVLRLLDDLRALPPETSGTANPERLATAICESASSFTSKRIAACEHAHCPKYFVREPSKPGRPAQFCSPQCANRSRPSRAASARAARKRAKERALSRLKAAIERHGGEIGDTFCRLPRGAGSYLFEFEPRKTTLQDLFDDPVARVIIARWGDTHLKPYFRARVTGKPATVKSHARNA